MKNENNKNENTRHETADSRKENSKKRTPKQIGALLCVFLLIGLYIFTLIAACLDFPGADRLFAACLIASVGLPILLWIYIWLYGIMKDRISCRQEQNSKEQPPYSEK